MLTVQSIALIVIAYLLGSIAFAMVAAKLFKFPDPRTAGSNNAGATNVLRISGSKKAAIFVVVCDIAKGIIPVLIAKALGLSLFVQGLVALCAVLGHIFPVFYLFRGGKGVATTIGVLYALNIGLGIAASLIWIIIAVLFRYSSLASILMMVMIPGYAYAMKLYPLLPSLLLLTGIILICHRANIKRLILGQETKIGKK